MVLNLFAKYPDWFTVFVIFFSIFILLLLSCLHNSLWSRPSSSWCGITFSALSKKCKLPLQRKGSINVRSSNDQMDLPGHNIKAVSYGNGYIIRQTQNPSVITRNNTLDREKWIWKIYLPQYIFKPHVSCSAINNRQTTYFCVTEKTGSSL